MKYKNNPLNIRYSPLNKWIGLCGHRNGFCEFETLDYGVRAACILLMRSYRKKGVKTYSEIINRFAPSSENPTSKYLDFVLNFVHAFPFDIPDSSIDFAYLISAMFQFEQGCVSYLDLPCLNVNARYIISISDYTLTVINIFKIKIYG